MGETKPIFAIRKVFNALISWNILLDKFITQAEREASEKFAEFIDLTTQCRDLLITIN